MRDHVCHGRLFATVGAHGGLLGVGYWGRQHLGAKDFFRGDAESAWVKLFRVRVRIDGQRFYLTLNNTRLYPFGYTSRCRIGDAVFELDLLLLPDALVQRARVRRNPRRRTVQFEMVHQEACTAVGLANRTWDEFTFDPKVNALIVSCRDENPQAPTTGDEQGSLAQQGLEQDRPDAPLADTWIGVGCDAPLDVRRGYHRRSKHYLASRPLTGSDAAYFVVFAPERAYLCTRLTQLSRSVHAECDALRRGYERRLRSRPRIDVIPPGIKIPISFSHRGRTARRRAAPTRTPVA